MIIKSLSRKGTKRSTVKQLLSYMFQEYKQSDFFIPHNIKGTTIDDYTNAIMSNEKNRIHIRCNSVLVYHDIISIHHLDSSKVNQSLLKAITKKYIQLRNPNALYIVVPHYDKKSIHLHFAISGIDTIGKANRISRERFMEIKIELQNRFPKLEHSIVEHGKKEKQLSEKEYQIKKRIGATEKEHTRSLLEILFKQSTSQADFYKRIQENGLSIYERNGKPYGVTGKRKMRFTTLGFNQDKFNILNQISAFEKLRIDKQERSIESNFYI